MGFYLNDVFCYIVASKNLKKILECSNIMPESEINLHRLHFSESKSKVHPKYYPSSVIVVSENGLRSEENDNISAIYYSILAE